MTDGMDTPSRVPHRFEIPPPPVRGTEPDTFGELLRYLRRRAGLTQRELGRAVGYSEGQICRLEQSQRKPDPTTVAALFLPALKLSDPRLAARLLQLATSATVAEPARAAAPAPAAEGPVTAVPAPPPYVVPRAGMLDLLRYAALEADVAGTSEQAGAGVHHGRP